MRSLFEPIWRYFLEDAKDHPEHEKKEAWCNCSTFHVFPSRHPEHFTEAIVCFVFGSCLACGARSMKSQRRTAQTQVNSSEKPIARLTCFFHRQYSARVPSFMQCVVQLRAAFPEMRLLLLYASSFFRVSPALIPPRRGKSIKKVRKSWLFATVLLTCVLIC